MSSGKTTNNPAFERLTQPANKQSNANYLRNLDKDNAALEKELKSKKTPKESSFVTRMQNVGTAQSQINVNKMKGSTRNSTISNTETAKPVNKNAQKIEALEVKYSKLESTYNKLKAMLEQGEKIVKMINSAIDKQLYKKKPDYNLESTIQETGRQIGNNLLGLGANITNKNFTDKNQTESTYETVKHRTSPLGKAEKYKENVQNLSERMLKLQDKLLVQDLSNRYASDLLGMLAKQKGLNDEIQKEKIKVNHDMKNTEVDIKYAKEEGAKQEKKGGTKPTPKAFTR